MTLPSRLAPRGLTGTAAAAVCIALLAATPAAALDCKSAATDQEKAICADPAAQAADAAMGQAFAALRTATPAAGRAALVADQHAWLATRDGDCATDANNQPLAAPALSACLKTESEQRRLFLSGLPISGPGASSPLRPFFLKGKGSDTIISGLKFAAPQSPGEKLFNTIVDKELKGVHLSDGSEGDATDDFYMVLNYASPAFISAHITYAYESSAHPMNYGHDINIALSTGKEVKFADVFKREALEPLITQCRPQLDDYIGEAAKADIDADMRDSVLKDREKTVREAVGDLTHWSFGGPKTTITIDDPAADTEIACSFDPASLTPMMQPGYMTLP